MNKEDTQWIEDALDNDVDMEERTPTSEEDFEEEFENDDYSKAEADDYDEFQNKETVQSTKHERAFVARGPRIDVFATENDDNLQVTPYFI